MTPVRLNGMTWNHPRGLDSLLACSEPFGREHPEITVDWDARSLQDFADFPLSELADRYDLLVFDHPFAGEVAASRMLVPLDEVLPAEFVADQAAHSVGPSYDSYVWDGHPWALAVDAACQVSAHRADLVEHPPRDWDDVLSFARSGAPMAIPARPIDSFLSFVSILANDAGQPFGEHGGLAAPGRAAEALERLAELLALAHPMSISMNPIELLEVMARTDEVAYMPITFGYVNYATPGFRERRVTFGPIPSGARGISGGVLGGAGLGISTRSSKIAEAAELLRFVASGAIQGSAYVAGGGQPGHRSAWLDPDVNAAHGNFFADTLNGIDGAYLRPRWPGYLRAQTAAGELVHGWLTDRTIPAQRLVRELDALFSAAHRASVVSAQGSDTNGR
jgi:multiple sugar transport system substrate-binding protein